MPTMRYLFFFFILIFLAAKSPDWMELRYPATYEAEQINKTFELIEFNDTIGNDSLFVLRNEDGLPHSYARNILTGVCIDGTCRLLNISLYWTVTGRYLGFRLPEGEFLSKTEHEPFQPKDYQQLHQLLADPFSRLANYQIEELVPKTDEEEVDGVTSATITGIKDFVVENAVYTTYTLWHIVHGLTQQQVENYTQQHLSTELLLKILSSSDQYDVQWGLKNITDQTDWTPDLLDQLFSLVTSNNLTTAKQAIDAIPVDYLEEEASQLRLFSYFDQTTHFSRLRILNKLKQVAILSPSIEAHLANQLPTLNGSAVKAVLELFSAHQLYSAQNEKIVASLLEHDNRFIARKAFQFLDNQPETNKKLKRQLKKFESRLN